MAASEKQPNTVPADQQRLIRQLLTLHTERSLAGALGVSRQTLGRALAGLPLHPGTLLLIAERLRAIAPAP